MVAILESLLPLICITATHIPNAPTYTTYANRHICIRIDKQHHRRECHECRGCEVQTPPLLGCRPSELAKRHRDKPGIAYALTGCGPSPSPPLNACHTSCTSSSFSSASITDRMRVTTDLHLHPTHPAPSGCWRSSHSRHLRPASPLAYSTTSIRMTISRSAITKQTSRQSG